MALLHHTFRFATVSFTCVLAEVCDASESDHPAALIRYHPPHGAAISRLGCTRIHVFDLFTCSPPPSHSSPPAAVTLSMAGAESS
eukprot:766406-Hanusia_phi.AAC.3